MSKIIKEQNQTSGQKTTGQKPGTNLPIRRRRSDEALWGGNRTNPMTLMRHLAEDMENMLMSDFGLTAPGFARSFFAPSFPALLDFPPAERESLFNQWSPQIEVYEKDGELKVQADLPGIDKENVKVEIDANCLTISGERRDEREERGDNFYRSERFYGNFYREIPLPEGVDTENVKATFDKGVLEVTLAAPAIAGSKRRVEIGAAEKHQTATGK
jgi:HSP20 family protein